MRVLEQRADGYTLFAFDSLDELDLDPVLAMIDRAWAQDYQDQARLDFNRKTLRKWTSGSHWIGVLACDAFGAPVGFELALERVLQVRGERLKLYYVTALTVAADHRQRGLGRLVLEGINQRVFEEQGADLILSTFHEGKSGSPAVQSTYDSIPGWGVRKFHRSPFWTRRLDKDPLPVLAQAAELSVVTRETPVNLERFATDGFELGFLIEKSLADQYLASEANGSMTLLYRVADRECLVCSVMLEMSINDKALRPIGQLQLLSGHDLADSEIERVVHQLGLHFAEAGCFSMTIIDVGMVPRPVLHDLGFRPTEDEISFAVRGPLELLTRFNGVSPPFFVDFT